ncbi:hypothetical protein [Athalassotoga sp.]|uniref:hypothetical protein n=1 Tax=Athalassotoga sp. TaxID=2022597 RepID=UPI003D03B083
MKKVIFLLIVLITVVSLFAGAQIIQMQVQVYPQQVLANAPFKVFVSAYSTSGEPISYITTTFDGKTLKATGSTAAFDFTAPSVIQSSQDFPLLVNAITQNGESFDKQTTVTVSINANPVIEIGKLIPSRNSYIGNVSNVTVPVKVYGGLGLAKIEFMVDTQVASVINVSPSATVYLSRSFNVEISHLKNGWHIFSVKTVNVAGEIFSSIAGYVVDTNLPVVKFLEMKPYLPANSNVPINVTAISTTSGIATVVINGINAKLLYNSTWGATISTPSKTGPFGIIAMATDGAGNQSSSTIRVISDGMPPYLKVTNTASMTRNGIMWGKYDLPSLTFMATTFCAGMAPQIAINVNGKKITDISQATIEEYSAKIATVSFKSSGTYKVNIAATDTISGLSTSASYIVNARVDNQNPHISNVSYNKYIGPNETMKISVVATDDNGIGVSKIMIGDKAASKVNDDTWEATLLSAKSTSSGYEKFTVKAIDYLGNESSLTEKYFVDVNPPHISMISIASTNIDGTYWNKGNEPIKIEISATTDSGVSPQTEVIINKDPIAYSGNNFTSIDLTSPGTYTITVVSTNQVNGLSTVLTKTYKLAFDTIPPQIEKITLPSTTSPANTFVAKIKVSDENGPGISSVTINDVNAKASGTTWIATLTSPKVATSTYVQVKITAYDKLNLSTSASTRYFVDAKPPYVEIVPIAQMMTKDGQYWNLEPPAYIKISATTDSKVMPDTTVNINGNIFKLSQESTEIRLNSTGFYSVDLTSMNKINGLKTESTKDFYFAFDLANPQIVNVTYPATYGPNTPLKITIQTNDGTGIGIKEVTVDGIKAVNVSDSTWIATITSVKISGESTFEIKATDYLGKHATPVVKRYFVDTQPAVINVYLDGQKLENGSEFYAFEKSTPTIAVSGITSGMMKPEFQITLNGKKVENQSFSLSGINDLNILATNPVNGKTSMFNARLAIFVDPSAPVVSLSIPSTITMRSDAMFKLNVEGKDLRYASLNANLEDKPLYFNIFSSTGAYTVSLRKAFADIDGKYVKVELKAVDMAGNNSSQDVTVYVDTLGPAIKDVKLSNETLSIYFNKDIEGTPVVNLEDLNGKITNLGTPTINGNVISVKDVKIPYGPYIVTVNGITDMLGNVLMNNGSIWEF